MQIQDYTIKATLHIGRHSTIYRAVCKDDGIFRILKLVEKQQHLESVLAGAEKEYRFLKQIDSDYVIKALDWIETNEYCVIILEDAGGQSLQNLLHKKGAMPAEQFLPLAILLVDGLAAVHQHNIIHKDINPSNILWKPQTQHLKLIDFNISSAWNLKVPHLGNPETLEGTLAYIAPEQTGRMNRSIDLRSDLYSLGVTFYEMLSGRRPFDSDDPMKLVHAHLAETPQSPHLFKKDVPEILSKLIMKLLAKNPEERYQSADGVKYDLEKIMRSDVDNPENFLLGEQDFSDQLQIPEKLYGREAEIELLLQSYQRVKDGAQEMILVAGFSGSGKTTLVYEIHIPISKDRGYFISGKFEQFQRSTPYFAFKQAFGEFCRLLLTETPEVVECWKDNILQAVGSLGKILTEFIPELELIVGPQPDIPEAHGEEARNRFYYATQRFLQAISSPEHPLVVFLDDLQWADLASLELLQHMVSRTHNQGLLCIGAYRDNEISPSHPLTTTLENIARSGMEIHTISVTNLSLLHVRDLLVDTLRIHDEAAQQHIKSFADLIYQKTEGNAFFTLQFLENLYREDLLRFNFSHSRWTWELQEIASQRLSDNVVDLLVKKINTLAPDARDALQFASCIGNVFHLQTLSVISNHAKEKLSAALEYALAEQLISPVEEDVYKFVHDRVHQAAYSLIVEEDKPGLHLKVGRLLLKMYEASQASRISEETKLHIFDIVNNLNIGVELIEDAGERLELARLNLKAAQQAKISSAYMLASEYMNHAVKLLPEDCWQQSYHVALALYSEAVQIAYLCGEFEKMESFIENVLLFAHDVSEKAVAYECRLMSFMARQRPDRAVETMLDVFSQLGEDMPLIPGKIQTAFMILGTSRSLMRHVNSNFEKVSRLSEPQYQMILRLFSRGAEAFAFAYQAHFPFITAKMTSLLLRYGLPPETPHVLSLYGILWGHEGKTAEAYQLGKCSLNLLDSLRSHEMVKAKTLGIAGIFLLGWRQHFYDASRVLEEGFHCAFQLGDFEFASYNLTHSLLSLSRTEIELSALLDKARKVNETIENHLHRLLLLPLVKIEISTISYLLALEYSPLEIEQFDKDKQDAWNKLNISSIYLKKLFLAYLFEEYEHIPEYLKELEDAWGALVSPAVYILSDVVFYSVLAYSQICTTVNKYARKPYLRKIQKNIRTMKKWANAGPINFLHRYYLMQAEFFRINGRERQAAQLYDKAIDTAYQHEHSHEAALACELAAKLYMQTEKHQQAEFYFQKAWLGYNRWGAIAKVKHLEERYPKYLRQTRASGATSGSTTSTGTTAASLDIHTILKATRTLSGSVQLKSLLEKMMQIILENAGAQRGLFIEARSETLLIQAVGDTNSVSDVLAAIPLEDTGRAPLGLLNYVARSKTQQVFDHLSKEAAYRNDPYVQQQQPQSAACVPVLKQGEVMAMLYLENNAVEGAFTPARLELLKMLSAQIAISIENAELYENLEKRVRQRTAELRQAHSRLQEAHKELTDNVNYSAHIQQAVLPEEETMKALFPEHFVLLLPHSTVSGDFFWARQVEGKIVAAAADCTGHGVTGALLSMLGTAFLNEVVPALATEGRLEADLVLNALREKVKTALRQRGEFGEQREGMDLALCILDPAAQTLQFAGAYNPLYLIRAGELTEFKAERMPIGIHRREEPFSKHDMSYQAGDMLYLFSDGFQDQHSGEGKGGFGKKRFKQLLLDIHQQEAPQQRESLLQAFNAWKGERGQTDDVLVMGVRLGEVKS